MKTIKFFKECLRRFKVNNYFKRSEFACKCGCGFDVVDAELLEVLTDVREKFGPIIINSGCRCANHNKNSGGATSSQHLLGKAADIRSPKVSTDEIEHYLLDKYPDKYGIARESRFVHIDVRSTKHRWSY